MNIDIKAMGYQHKKKPTTFTQQCPSLERGFVESVKKWHEQMENPKLVIIDPFQYIKPLATQRNANAYEIDYYYLSQLHELAKELKLCIIYVHHLSQADKSHTWDKIMGSTGHQGVTDAMYMLERDSVGPKATLKGIGRNIAGFEINIEWNANPKQPFTFQYAGNTYQAQTEKHKRDIYLAMKQLAKDDQINVKPADVYKVLNLVNQKEKNACNKNMQRMKDRSELRQGDKFGEYCLAVDVSRIDDHGNIKSDDIF
jgi:RecA-family ATPase